ncbi:chorismate mutase [Thermoanaerobacter mathranii subsp. mathranii str. A3]|uniref:chorismate mutase n=1 Tax=Thermoanaerobacter mathranii subsp. mathranii (strain DSM 11426 / CCUG 53645 / CIP 108742 / A3) TaxID=583358 RepID=A0ABM5LQB1_THEM3|nr:chorismate mutase [Thermoanaerobacter thermocopriae]ADH60913.1 chorismate mutase [Thermoanaerobacter mathranii subsp. mathranii str. A3]MBT1279888.1 chorismate mutase [Thermoanaerobacter sp. CM-CNRG TB177]
MKVIRGAITSQNTKEDILKDTTILIEEIIKANELEEKNIISIFFSVTCDLDAVYPAEAVRNMGMTSIPMMCLQEMEVKGSLSHCIRVAVFTNLSDDKEVKHIYLKEAKKLRPDLV